MQEPSRPNSNKRPLKRGLDVVGATVGLIVLSPVMLGLALVVRLCLGAPVLFRQMRPGMHGNLFVLYKFRTMREATDAFGRPLPDAQRLTRLGRFLRRTSLDELPELWNVLRGDMSLVGPRPLLPQYLDRYTAHHARRHEVPPGLTGWAQIHGRNAISWEERLELDVWYVDHQDLWLDLQILFATVGRALCQHGITAASHETMPEFTGSESARDVTP